MAKNMNSFFWLRMKNILLTDWQGVANIKCLFKRRPVLILLCLFHELIIFRHSSVNITVGIWKIYRMLIKYCGIPVYTKSKQWWRHKQIRAIVFYPRLQCPKAIRLHLKGMKVEKRKCMKCKKDRVAKHCK